MTAVPMRNATVVAGLFGIALAGQLLQASPTATAAEPVRGRIELETVDVPADQPKAWPKEVNRMIPVPRQEFTALIKQLNASNTGPRSAWLKSAHYEATLVNNTLQGGLMTASVQRFGSRSTLLDLGPFSFALDHLKWQDRPAIWGSSTDGHAWLLLDGNNDELLGEWSCKGRTFPGGIDFDLQLPPATVSFLDVRIPKGFSVFAPTAEVTQLTENSQEETQLWRIYCSHNSRCRVTFLAREGVEEPRRSLFVEHDMQVVVGEDDLRFKLNLYLEALDAPIQDLTLKTPPGLVIYSAVFGVDTPVPIQRISDSEAEGRLSIRLPGPLSSRKRALRIDGIAVRKPGQPIIVPQLVVENSTFDGGHLAVTVQAPLQVRSMQFKGYRQRTTDGESLTFDQLTPDSQLILDVHRAQVSLSGQVLSVLDVDEDSWNLTTEIVWNSQTGNAYQTSCAFPPEWDVTDVTLVNAIEEVSPPVQPEEAVRPRGSPKLNWDVKQQPNGRSLVAIEFLESIQPGQARAVKVRARRRPPQSGQPEPMPIPQLVNCDVSEVILGIQFPSSLTPVVSADSRLERIARPTSTLFTLPPDFSASERHWYRADSTEGTGTLQLKPRLQPIHAKTETNIVVLPTEYRLKYSVQSEQWESGNDRMLVYLTEASPDVRWTWKGPQTLDLTATRLSKSQHVEWNLPSKGELWEIRLPRGISSGITIEGVANNRWSATNRPALLFVPQAVEKLSELKLTQPDSLEITIDTDGLKPTGQRHSWWYATPQVQLDLALRNPEPSRDFPLMISMQLRTLMSAEKGGFDIYRARLQLENGSAQESLRIKLDSSAVVQEAFVGGESIAATYQGGEFVIPGLNAARRDTVEIIYRVPAQANVLFERRRIVVPSVSAQVLGFFWEFGIPPSARMYAEPSGIRLSRSLPSPSWNERFLGPLGRSAREAVFNPLRFEAWMELFQPRPTSPVSIDDSDGELVAPIEWQVHQAAVTDAPTELWVELWNASRIQMLTWMVLGWCLSLGIVLRMIGWSHRDLLAAYWLGFCFATASCVSAPYAGILGAAIAGTLIALLIPRQLLRRESVVEEVTTEHQQIPYGIIISSLLGGATFFAAFALAGNRILAQEPATEDTVVNHRVYVAVDANGQPSEKLPLVYVSREALARWKAMAADLAPEPRFLIASARYQISSAADGNLGLLARYRVHLLPSVDATVTVPLPLSDVILPDADSCRVNGRPHAISALTSGKGYLIELTRDLPSDLNVTSDPIENAPVSDKIATFEIEFRARKTRTLASGFELHIPPVASNVLTMSFSEPTAFAEVAGGRGLSNRDSQSGLLSSDLGAVSTIQVRWGSAPPERKPAQLNASILQHLELRPACAELNFHLLATIEEGSVDTVEFNLPPNGIVRKNLLRADDLLRSDVIQTRDGQRRLRLVFDKSRQGPIRIDGALVLLQSEPLARTPLPKFGLTSTESLQIQYEHNWWGVSTTTDFRIEPTNLEPEDANMISSEAYMNAWLDADEPRHVDSFIPRPTQWAFEAPEGLTPAFTLVPQLPRRRALQWKQTGFIGKRRLEWTLVGEIETTQAATFQTVLNVDRRLRIEKLTVMENDAERRVRRTESRGEPSRVVLFLSDKTQGKQTITLKGSLPITPGTPIVLPSILPEDCEVTDARLVLTRDPEVDVTFTPPGEWKQLATEETASIDGPVVLGSFQIADSPARATIQTSARHSRCTCHAAVLMNRVDGSSWQLKYRLELFPEGDSPLRIGLSFPSTFTDMNSVTVERAEPAWHEVHDRQLDLLLNRSEPPGRVVVQFESTLTEPTGPDWVLPLPTPLSPNSYDVSLVINPASMWFPTKAVESRVADLPEWSSEFYSDLPGSDVAFRITRPTIELERDVVTSELRDPSIRLLDQRMWLHAAGRRSGITQAFLSYVRNDLELRVPSHVSVSSIFLDDHPLALTTPVEGRLKIPMTDAGTESLLTITWFDEGAPRTNAPVADGDQFLWPLEIRVERNLVTILPDDPTRLWLRSGLTATGSLDQGLDRLQTLLDRHAALGNETRGALANRWLLDQLQARLAARLPSEVQHPNEEVANRLRRWTQIIGAINQLEPVPAAPPISWHVRLLDGPATDGAEAIRGTARPDHQIRFWQFDRRVIQILCASVLTLILIPLFRRTIRIEWSRWLHRHTAISWSLLAAVWWLFLTPSAFGPVLLVIGLFRTYLQYNSVRTAA